MLKLQKTLDPGLRHDENFLAGGHRIIIAAQAGIQCRHPSCRRRPAQYQASLP
jgi:hypothetical protein